MESIYLSERVEKDEFAKRAAKYFAENQECRTYTDEEIKSGCYFAVRWGLGEDGVVVFKIDEYTHPVNYMELVRAYS
jgi:hypothetical protein